MESDKTEDEKVQEYYNLSLVYLKSAEVSLERGLYEPALFNAIHALELALKSALLKRQPSSWKTHNVGGIFSKLFKTEVNDEDCRRINVILSKYNLPRYPSNYLPDATEIERDIAFIKRIICDIIPELIRS